MKKRWVRVTGWVVGLILLGVGSALVTSRIVSSLQDATAGQNQQVDTDEPAPTPKPAIKINVYDLWTEINEERTKLGLPPLKLDPYLNGSASEKCQDMAQKDYWGHYGPDGTAPWFYIKKYRQSYNKASENLAFGFITADGVVRGWMKSPTHKANIVDPVLEDVGFGVCHADVYQGGKDQTIVVQHFTGM